MQAGALLTAYLPVALQCLQLHPHSVSEATQSQSHLFPHLLCWSLIFPLVHTHCGRVGCFPFNIQTAWTVSSFRAIKVERDFNVMNHPSSYSVNATTILLSLAMWFCLEKRWLHSSSLQVTAGSQHQHCHSLAWGPASCTASRHPCTHHSISSILTVQLGSAKPLYKPRGCTELLFTTWEMWITNSFSGFIPNTLHRSLPLF